MKKSKGRKNTGKTKNKVMVRSSSEGLTLLWIFSYSIVPSGINPTTGIGSTQGQRKTLTKVGFEPTTFGLDHHTAQLHSCEKIHSNVKPSFELQIITDDMLPRTVSSVGWASGCHAKGGRLGVMFLKRLVVDAATYAKTATSQKGTLPSARRCRCRRTTAYD